MIENVTAVSDIANAPVRLDQNFPNPFNNSTEIRFSTDKSERITLRVFTISGEQVEVLMSKVLQPGEYSVVWNAQNQPDGIYFYTISAGSYRETKKMSLLK